MVDETAQTNANLVLRARLEEVKAELEECRMRVIRETIASRQAKLAADKMKRALMAAGGGTPGPEPEAEELPNLADELFATLLAQTGDLKEQIGRAARTAHEAQQAITRIE